MGCLLAWQHNSTCQSKGVHRLMQFPSCNDELTTEASQKVQSLKKQNLEMRRIISRYEII